MGAVAGVAMLSAWACSHDNEPSRAANHAADYDRSVAERQMDVNQQRAPHGDFRGEYHAESRPETREQARAIGGGPREPDRRFNATVTKISNARCDREVKCGHVGPSEKFSSRDQCISKTQNDKYGDLNGDVCTLGISQQGLHECLQAIRDEGCSNPLDSISRISACRSGNLCLK
jgi:hypothetical protein